jgi:hypothetical protein
MDLWLPPKPAIIIPKPDIKRPVDFAPAWLPGMAMPFAIGGIVSAFPVVQTTAIDFKTFNTTNTANLPAGIVAGDLILLFGRYNVVTLTFPSGWTQLFEGIEPNNTIKGGCFFKIATGGETTVSITASASTAIQTIAYRISGQVGVPEAVTTNGSGNTSSDPPNLAPSWGTKKTLWIAHTAHQLNAVTASPSGYTNQIVAANNTCVTIQRNLEAASENPGPWTLSGSQGWRASTVAVQGT